MKLRDWIMFRNTVLGEASGDRINEAIVYKERSLAGLPPQQKAWLIDKQGTKDSHDVNIQRNGEPHMEVIITRHEDNSPPERKVYEYAKELDGYLVYYQI